MADAPSPPPPPAGGYPPPPGGYPRPSGAQPPPPAGRPPAGQPPPSRSTPSPPPPGATGYGSPGHGWSDTGPAEHGGLGLALVGGIAGAFVAGLIWWGIVATTKYQVTYVALGVGWVVAQAVLICCQQRNRVPLQAVAGVFTLLSLAASEYFIQRTLFIQEYGDRFDGADVPLWSGFGSASDTVQEVLRDDPLTGLFWVAAAVTAVIVAGSRDAITRSG